MMINNSTSITLSSSLSSTTFSEVPKVISISQKHVLITNIFKQIQWHTILDNHYINRNEVTLN